MPVKRTPPPPVARPSPVPSPEPVPSAPPSTPDPAPELARVPNAMGV
jgi:hypothetical protein